MTVLSFFGCLLTAYSPALVVFFVYVGRSPQLVILLVSSAFFWLFSILLAAIFWYIIPPLYDVHEFTIAFSVLFQELFRWLFYLLFNKAENGLNTVAKNPTSPFNRIDYSFVSGLGFGVMSSIIAYVSVLIDSIGPGFIPCQSCPRVSLFYISALTTLFMQCLHVAWMMLAFDGFRNRNWIKILYVIGCHMGASYFTLFNSSSIHLGCLISLMGLSVLLAISTIWIVRDIAKLKASTLVRD